MRSWEVVADLVGDYLFTDKDFVQQLSTGHRNVFQKIYDEVKYLCKAATTGSKEARQLQKVKKIFEEAYRAETKIPTGDGGIKYDIVALNNGNVYVKASRNVITGQTKADQRKNITEFFNDLLKESPSLDIQTIEGDVLTITKADTADKARDDYKTVNRQQVKMTDDEFSVKLRIESHIDEVTEISTKRPGWVPDGKNHAFAKDGFTYRRAYFEDFDGQYYEITLSIGHNGTVATVYNVGKIDKGVLPSAKVIAVVGSKALGKTPSTFSLSEKTENVNTKDSISEQRQVEDFGPVAWQVKGEDVALGEVGPVAEDASASEVESGYGEGPSGTPVPTRDTDRDSRVSDYAELFPSEEDLDQELIHYHAISNRKTGLSFLCLCLVHDFPQCLCFSLV